MNRTQKLYNAITKYIDAKRAKNAEFTREFEIDDPYRSIVVAVDKDAVTMSYDGDAWYYLSPYAKDEAYHLALDAWRKFGGKKPEYSKITTDYDKIADIAKKLGFYCEDVDGCTTQFIAD